MQSVTLNNGVEMPILGFGVYRIATLETAESLFFDHRDPAMTARLGGVRVD